MPNQNLDTVNTYLRGSKDDEKEPYKDSNKPSIHSPWSLKEPPIVFTIISKL